MRDNLMLRLKTQTAPEHRRLEASLDLMREGMTLDDYGAVLQALLGFIGPWEEAARARLPASLVTAFDARRKTGALRDDLRVLARLREARPLMRIVNDREHGFDTNPTTSAQAGASELHATRSSVPAFDSTAAWLGSWYVIEGSTLGGQILAPHFGDHFGLTSKSGVRYFSGYGPRTGSMWNAFRALLVEAIEPAAVEAAVEGARRTFVHLHRWLIEAGTARELPVETMQGAG
jgi:heme oxygenase (biliverdin-IX-beta and delta-forming)